MTEKEFLITYVLARARATPGPIFYGPVMEDAKYFWHEINAK